MPALGLGLSIYKSNNVFGSLGQTMAQAHYDRVVADGGVLPIGVAGLASVLNSIAAAYNVSTTAAFNAAVPVFLDPHYTGYKLGTGSGTTLGQAARTVYAINSSADVTQATAASQPLLLAHSGVNYWWNPCVTNNSVTSGTALTYNPVTDTLIVVSKIFSPNQGTGAAWDNITNQNTLFGIQLSSNGTSKQIRVNASTSATASTSYTPSTTSAHYVKVQIDLTQVSYYWSADGSTYTAIGTSTLPTFGTTGTLTIGGSANSTSNNHYNYLTTYSVNGTITKTFNPASYTASTSQTQWTSTTGEVWTINTGTAATGYKGVLVDRTIMQGDGVDDRLVSGTLTSRALFSRYAATNPLNINIFKGIVGANTADRHYLYATVTDVAIYNGVTLTFSGEQANRIALFQCDYNGASGSTLLNNTTSSSGNVGTGTSTVLELFALVNGSFGNVIITTIIDSSGIDTIAQKTAMYNIIRAMNNNAF